MAEIPLKDGFCYVAGYDFTVDTNSAALNAEVAALDATTLASGGWTELAGGLKTVNFAYSGFWQAAADDQAPDNQAFPMLSTSQVYTFGANEVEGAALGACYMFQAQKSQYTLGGAVGELAPFSLTANGSDAQGVVRGRLAKAKGSVSATGALGTGIQLSTVSSSQYLYATFHVFTAGTTITVQVQSDDNSGFTSPTTVATIGPLTTSGGSWMTRVAGPLTDTWYRFNVSAITETFTVAGAIGKQ